MPPETMALSFVLLVCSRPSLTARQVRDERADFETIAGSSVSDQAKASASLAELRRITSCHRQIRVQTVDLQENGVNMLR